MRIKQPLMKIYWYRFRVKVLRGFARMMAAFLGLKIGRIPRI